MEKVLVSLGKRSYPITIATNLFKNAVVFSPLKAGNQVMLITNETIANLYLDIVSKTLESAGIKVDKVILPDGEQYKNLMTLNIIFTALLEKTHNRDTILIALGGGVVGDLVGFAAASYQRGVRFIQIPTTLLSQVDSSVGGKTAINHPLGKNMIGAFHQPISVIINIDCLKTLPSNELASGLAEVIKYGIILDGKFFSWLEENMDALLRLDSKAVKYCIRRCCELKANIIAVDEYESGLRSILNFGHTYGHAIEVEMGYGNWLHGEAIAVGIVMAARTSEQLGLFTAKETQRIIMLLKNAGLPVMGPKDMSAKSYLFHMIRDKKTLSGRLRLVIPLSIGKGKIYDGISQKVILTVLSKHNASY